MIRAKKSIVYYEDSEIHSQQNADTLIILKVKDVAEFSADSGSRCYAATRGHKWKRSGIENQIWTYGTLSDRPGPISASSADVLVEVHP
jgi:hypothetical protein